MQAHVPLTRSIMPRSAFVVLVSALLAASSLTAAQTGPVRAVLFFSPTCPHCHVVMTETLPPLTARYGSRLVVAAVDVSTPEGQALYTATVRELGIPASRIGVPTLVVGKAVMVGSAEIPERLPGLVEDGLAGGGVAWPAVAELQAALQAGGAVADAPGGTSLGDADAPTLLPLAPSDTGPASPLDRYLLDPVGNSVAVGVLLVLLSVLAWTGLQVRTGGLPTHLPGSPVAPVLLALGLGVAAYLSYVEVTGSAAVCGPVGDCNTVQQSPWARLFGVLPVGVLGMAGYLAMGAAWLAAGRARLAVSRRGAVRLFWLMAFLGTAFSAWLTFLEPFVIGATCAWCVTSALVIAALLAMITPRGPSARRRA